jgi:protein required for attachment to host cells
MTSRSKRSSLGPARPDLLLKAARLRNKKTTIVVADGARARFFTPSDDARALRSSGPSDMVWPASRTRPRDLKSDKPGRSFARANSNRRGAVEPPHDVHKLEKHRFTLELAHALNAAFERREFDQLVVVAPRRSLGELRKLLPIRVLRVVVLEIAKDLTAETPAALWKRVAPEVMPLL